MSAGLQLDQDGFQNVVAGVEVLGPTGWAQLAAVDSKAIKAEEDAEKDRHWTSTTCRYLECVRKVP